MRRLFSFLPFKTGILLGCILLSILSPVQAQSATGIIRGLLSDNMGPLPGATVLIVGTKTGVVADANGRYRLTVAPGTYTVAATFVGYARKEVKSVTVKAGSEQVVDIQLGAGEGNQLQEVTVSYGRQRRREITGSVATLDASLLEDMPVQQFAQQLQGKIAGVSVQQSSGQPGRGADFRIRGAASFYSENQPLFVVDGLPITGSINNVNPNEIESYSVLKDASATALYGSRGANGVVLITTKHAKAGDAKIEFNASYGVQKLPGNRVPKVMDAQQYATFMNERYQDIRKYENPATTTPAEYENPSQYGEGTNWYTLLTRTAPIQNYDLTVQSATEKSSSTALFGYQEQQGVLINTGTRLFSGRLNKDMTIAGGRIKLGFGLAPSYRIDHNNRLATDGVGGLFERIFEASPLKSPYNADGSYNRDTYSPGMVAYINPLAQFNLTNDDYKTTRMLGNAFLNYTVVKGLQLKFNAGIDKGNEIRHYYQSGVVNSTVNNPNGTSSAVDNGSYTAEGYLDYNLDFRTDHQLNLLAGYSAQKFTQESNTLSGLGFANDDITYLTAATSVTGSSNYTAYSLLSTLVRLNYSFKGRYLLQGAFRRDGSSRFGTNRQYGDFPSVSAGWIVSDESFMKRFKAINLLKVRASYGVTGNNFFGNYVAQSTTANYYYDFNNVITQGTTIGNLGNPNLRWERSRQFDLGFDLTLLNNRLNVTYDYYFKNTDGLIQSRPLPTSSGYTSILDNVGALAFWGHEITLNTVNISRPDFRWNSSFNVSFDRNQIKALVDPGYIRRNNTVTSDYFRNQADHALGEFYGFVFLGLYKDAADLDQSAKYQATATAPNGLSDIGTIKVKDINGDGVIDDVNDRTFIGNPTPAFTGGFSNNLTYKKFDLNISTAFSVGGQLLNAAKWAYQTNLDGSRVPLAAAADRWRSLDNPGSGVYPRTKTGTTGLGRSVNSQWLENATYFTIKNVSLGYTFGLNDRSALRGLRIYGSIQQALVLTGYSGMNPEINFAGQDATLGLKVDENAYPIPRTFAIGLTATFR
ncbi:SusC/RagA family TonB-linked outer membrane protein [Spirosoma endophyticum]|uniref:TonB-linked outer membrane protein, SusC/RagA family n=1 Tax=Spirosoma endophyticum TaxID=662367 RepID=A0A1I1TVB9_9BACT|nr:TonB-dependent receptor [Spirosoma endophyticum]SFD62626.1 TonB-linked outer membrane protein, SusC/RagA family [Spirosoma endophyticum]